jgi:hypothetical protein
VSQQPLVAPLAASRQGPADQPDHEARPDGRRRAAIGRAYAAGSGSLARFVQLVLSIVVLIIVAGILLALLRANPANGVVSEVHGWGQWLVGPFSGMFSFHRARVALAVNWGIAAVVYLFAGGLISRFIGRSHDWRPFTKRSSIPNQEAS